MLWAVRGAQLLRPWSLRGARCSRQTAGAPSTSSALPRLTAPPQGAEVPLGTVSRQCGVSFRGAGETGRPAAGEFATPPHQQHRLGLACGSRQRAPGVFSWQFSEAPWALPALLPSQGNPLTTWAFCSLH